MRLRLGVIGTGFAWERLHYPALKQLTDKYEIVAVCNKTIEKAQNFAKQINLPDENVYSDYREMLKRDDIDVVDLLVPISENYEVAKDVLNAGKNLIAEKPFASTVQSAKELIEIKNSKNLKIMVAENFRYDECNNIIKQAIAQGAIGIVSHFIFNTGADFENDMITDTFSAKEWRQHPQYEGGSFLDGGIHDIALMRFLFGDALNVKAFGNKQDKEYCEYRNINTLLRFNGDIIGNYTYYSSSAELQTPPIGLRIFGSNGDIYLESKTCKNVIINYKDGKSEKRKFTPENGYYNEFINYYDGNIVSTPEKELGDIELIFRILNEVKLNG